MAAAGHASTVAAAAAAVLQLRVAPRKTKAKAVEPVSTTTTPVRLVPTQQHLVVAKWARPQVHDATESLPCSSKAGQTAGAIAESRQSEYLNAPSTEWSAQATWVLWIRPAALYAQPAQTQKPQAAVSGQQATAQVTVMVSDLVLGPASMAQPSCPAQCSLICAVTKAVPCTRLKTSASAVVRAAQAAQAARTVALTQQVVNVHPAYFCLRQVSASPLPIALSLGATKTSRFAPQAVLANRSMAHVAGCLQV